MIKKIKKALIKLYRIPQLTKWVAQANRSSHREKVGTNASQVDLKCQRTLIIAPHSDDEFVGCFELMKKYGRLIDVFCVALTGYENSPSNKRKRVNEFIASAEKMNVNPFLPDDKGWEICLSNLIQENYGNVFIPSIVDWHWEHRLVSITVLNALLSASKELNIYFYQVSALIPGKYVNAYSIKTVEKWDIFFQLYSSQNYMPIQRFRISDKIYKNMGRRIEPYVQIDYNRIRSIIEKYNGIKAERFDDLKNSINDLDRIFVETNSLYEDLFLEEKDYYAR